MSVYCQDDLGLEFVRFKMPHTYSNLKYAKIVFVLGMVQLLLKNTSIVCMPGLQEVENILDLVEDDSMTSSRRTAT